MSILTRYIAATYLKLLVLCLGSFIAIYLVIDFLEKMGRFMRFQPQMTDVALFFACKIPEIIGQVTPMGVLMATLLTLGMLSRNSEITAMRSSGISLRRISTPILTIAFIASLGTIFLNELVIPSSYEKMRYIEEVKIRRKSVNTFFRQNNIWFKDENIILQARLFEPAHQLLRGVTLWETGSGMQPLKRIDADEGSWDGHYWVLKKVVTRELGHGEVIGTTVTDNLQVPLSLKVSDLKVVDKYADNMGFLKLYHYIRKLENGGYDPTRYRAQLHAKLSLPFSSFIMAFLGIPFALRSGRSSGIALGIGASIGIGFAYYVTNATILSFGQSGVLPPSMAAWAANIFFALTGIWLALTTDI